MELSEDARDIIRDAVSRRLPVALPEDRERQLEAFTQIVHDIMTSMTVNVDVRHERV